MHSFQEIRGNVRLLQHLRNAIKTGKVSHAYLLTGGNGIGKKTIAATIAKYLECTSPTDDVCGSCKSCRTFENGNHPDVVWIRREKNSIGVDIIKDKILDTIEYKPYSFGRKIYIIDDAHTMTPQAQNAFLKTLEEPPAYANFILLAENIDAFLPTVLSRVVELKVEGISEGEIARYLMEEKGIARDKSGVFAAYAQGRIGQAIEIAEDENFQNMRRRILEMVQQIPRASLGEVLLFAKELEEYKSDHRFLDIMEVWYRDLLVAKSLRNQAGLIQKDMQEELFLAAKDAPEQIAAQCGAIIKAKERLARNANFRLTMEVMLMDLKENKNI